MVWGSARRLLGAGKLFSYHSPSSRGLRRRRAFSLLELSIVTVILAIIATVTCGRFSDLLDRQRVSQCRSLVASNLLGLRRCAQTASTTLKISIPNTAPVLYVTPCSIAPTGSIRFAEPTESLTFAQVDFDGAKEFRILPSGALVRNANDIPLQRAKISVAAGSYTSTIDLLAN
ncbi:MAG TPA: hypothetical protein DDW52_17125 [Planctomycetaceae bacterium]|nr:hypothetical protein [Planctomycetaceae bacterium]